MMYCCVLLCDFVSVFWLLLLCYYLVGVSVGWAGLSLLGGLDLVGCVLITILWFVCLFVLCLLFVWMFVVYGFADCCSLCFVVAGFWVGFRGWWFGVAVAFWWLGLVWCCLALRVVLFALVCLV